MNNKNEPDLVKLTAGQLAGILKAVRADRSRESDPRRLAAGANGQDAAAHLTDEAFLALCTETAPAAVYETYLAHLIGCDACAAEYERLECLGAVWQNAEAVRNLEARKRSLRLNRSAGADSPPATLKNLLDKVRLGSLVLPQGAYAEQSAPAAESVLFPICQDGQTVPKLMGALKRRNREIYALISPDDPESMALYRDRSVRLVIADAPMTPPLLERKIAIGVAVLLGTGLALTAESYVQADLLSPREII